VLIRIVCVVCCICSHRLVFSGGEYPLAALFHVVIALITSRCRKVVWTAACYAAGSAGGSISAAEADRRWKATRTQFFFGVERRMFFIASCVAGCVVGLCFSYVGQWFRDAIVPEVRRGGGLRVVPGPRVGSVVRHSEEVVPWVPRGGLRPVAASGVPQGRPGHAVWQR
jgi:hypothetical protein